MTKLRLRKKRVLLFIVLSALLISIGITLAFMFKSSETIENTFFPAKVECEVEEEFDGTQKSSIAIKNTGNTDAYLRLRLVSYWVNGDGNIVGKESEMPEFSYDSANWTLKGDNTYEYKNPVAPNDKTAEFLTAPMTLKEDTYLGETVYQVVEVFADGIQSNPEEAKEVWENS